MITRLYRAVRAFFRTPKPHDLAYQVDGTWYAHPSVIARLPASAATMVTPDIWAPAARILSRKGAFMREWRKP